MHSQAILHYDTFIFIRCGLKTNFRTVFSYAAVDVLVLSPFLPDDTINTLKCSSIFKSNFVLAFVKMHYNPV